MTTTTVRSLLVALIWAVGHTADAQAPVAAAPGSPVELALEDQFGRPQSLAAMRGRVVVYVYGDRKGTDASRTFGEQLHVLFHPTAKGKSGAEARTAPVSPLPNVPAGQPSPEVLIVPVACRRTSRRSFKT